MFRCLDLLERANKESGENATAILNMLLLKWEVGKISDNDFQI
jgi:hypothetical protein